MQNSVENNQDDEVIIAKKSSGVPFLIGGIVVLVFSLLVLIVATLNKEYVFNVLAGLFFIVAVGMIIAYFYMRSVPNIIIKQINDSFEIYDGETHQYCTVDLKDIFNIESKCYNPNYPTNKGYLTFETQDKVIKTPAIDDYIEIKNYILSSPHRY